MLNVEDHVEYVRGHFGWIPLAVLHKKNCCEFQGGKWGECRIEKVRGGALDRLSLHPDTESTAYLDRVQRLKRTPKYRVSDEGGAE